MYLRETSLWAVALNIFIHGSAIDFFIIELDENLLLNLSKRDNF